MPPMRHASGHRTIDHRGFRFLAQACRPPAVALARWELPDVLPVPAPALFAGNHRSLFDIVVGFTLFWNFGASVRIVVASRYFDHPLMGPLLRQGGAISMGQGRSAISGIKACLGALEAGESVVIMPEGRLMGPGERPGGVGPAAAGIGVLAARSTAPLALCAITGTDEVWPPGKRFPRLRVGAARPTIRVRVEAVAPPAPEVRASRDGVTLTIMSALGSLVGEMEG